MKLKNFKQPAPDDAGPALRLSDPFFFLPLVAEALKDSEVSCPFCRVKMISRAGLVRGLCPACFEERCLTCGIKILLDDGGLAPGLTVRFGGSWQCGECAKARSRRTGRGVFGEACESGLRHGSRRLQNGSEKQMAA